MIVLGGLTLPSTIIWQDRYSWYPISQTAKVTLGGLTTIRTTELLNGRLVTLVSKSDMGWIPKSTFLSLQSMANSPGSAYTFNWNGEEIFQVVFRHHEFPALDIIPLIEGVTDPEYFIGTIKLMSM